MRIIFLNSWYAKAGKVFFDFIEKNSLDTDTYCLSEIHPGLFSKLELLLPRFKGFYKTSLFDRNMGYIYGQAVFVRREFDAQCLGKINTFRNVYNDVGFAVPYKLKISKKTLYIVNVHGKARPGHKLDTPARIRQSEKIIGFLKDKPGLKMIGGDLNLMPGTESVRMFEEAGYRNLIKEFNIKNTRNCLTWEQFPNQEKQHFADFVFVSKEIKVKSFKVPNVEVSDHLPLILDFKI